MNATKTEWCLAAAALVLTGCATARPPLRAAAVPSPPARILSLRRLAATEAPWVLEAATSSAVRYWDWRWKAPGESDWYVWPCCSERVIYPEGWMPCPAWQVSACCWRFLDAPNRRQVEYRAWTVEQ